MHEYIKIFHHKSKKEQHGEIFSFHISVSLEAFIIVLFQLSVMWRRNWLGGRFHSSNIYPVNGEELGSRKASRRRWKVYRMTNFCSLVSKGLTQRSDYNSYTRRPSVQVIYILFKGSRNNNGYWKFIHLTSIYYLITIFHFITS